MAPIAMKFAVAAALASASAEGAASGVTSGANPIRRVVSMLQKIQKKVEAEGETETELHEKFMCQCKTGTSSYTLSIADGEAKVVSLAAALESAVGQLAQLKSDLAGHKSDREAAKQALASAGAMREKEAATFAALKAESETNIAAMSKAVAAIEKGEAGSFLQTNVAQQLRDIASSSQTFSGDARQEVLAFLDSDSEEGSAGSGQIVGVLKQLGDEMKKDLADATAVENKSISDYNGLVTAKNAEVATLTSAIEDKISRIGETGLLIEDTKADAKDTAEKLAEDKEFLATLKSDCAKKEKEWAAVSKERQAELLALADTITMLNSDDALELFKKTLPSAASFMQVSAKSSNLKASALAMIRNAGKHGLHLDLIALALHGKTSDFSKVIGMIDEMVSVLGSEQKDDDEKKEYCGSELDATEDKIKGHEQNIRDSEAAVADAKETITTVTKEIEALAAGLTALDASVETATEQRQKENAAFKELRASNTAAKDLIGMAKKRLNKFYNPKLALISTSFLQVQSRVQPSLVQKKSEESAGVIAMMDTLAAELDKETTIATADEKDAQSDYETFMADSKKMRADNTKILQDKTAAKADAIGALESHDDILVQGQKSLKGAEAQLGALHGDCDWLLANFDARKEARADEVDSLKKAKAVLSGASFVQE
jgi:chromosome segregation ATPase